ncbi:DUF930 domain-containing protein [Phyllobacterium sp. TAF24]|uniref:DUF930 domain-containing protein n=1 Tax=unclassified Phyllobacterium TaxID=2638441 RepID=UPI000885D27A|nr:DUF930 domain-containing protein [Phyllobacterium sp. OV277]SDP06580.1 protein of unknown function [Phyllobacterium sp. OV277]
MKKPTLLFAILALSLQSASAMDTRMEVGLEKLDPQTRLEQRCDVEAMERIRKDEHGYNPDKVLAYAFADPKVDVHSIKSRGAAFRSRGEWYHLAFKCMTNEDNMEIVAFKYQIGDKVPKNEWGQHYLVP